jgi:site-specific recombinase XerD
MVLNNIERVCTRNKKSTLEKFLTENQYSSLATKKKYQRWVTSLGEDPDKPFEELTNDDLTAYMNNLKHLSIRSRNTVRQTLRYFLKWLGWKRDDFGLAMKHEKIHRKTLQIPKIEELEQLIEAAGAGKNGTRDQALVAMLTFGGMRARPIQKGICTFERIENGRERRGSS